MNFAITGVAGYVAPRHLEAIKRTENNLIACLDTHDAVGILDRYFPDCRYFSEFERFDRFLEKMRRKGEGIDYMSICSPNYLHDPHIRAALRLGANAICEKPLVISPSNLDALLELEKEYGKKVFCVLQLRLHPSIINLKNKVDSSFRRNYKVELSYVTPRGLWYNYSWKGDPRKSGGVAMNIGIHFFDSLIWIFGPVREYSYRYRNANTIEGIVELERAEVSWFLSTERRYSASGKPERSLTVDGEEVVFSDGFEDLHNQVYKDILSGGGYGIEDAYPAIELVFEFKRRAMQLAI